MHKEQVPKLAVRSGLAQRDFSDGPGGLKFLSGRPTRTLLLSSRKIYAPCTDKNQIALLWESFVSFFWVINEKKAFLQFNDTLHLYTRSCEVSIALSGMIVLSK
jgi:hypothetical protein